MRYTYSNMKTILRFMAGSAQDGSGRAVLGGVKTILRLLPLSVAALFLCGCGPGYTFTPWMGQQQNWATGPGGYVRMVNNVPIFSPGQMPPKPYYIVGSVSTDNEGNLAKAVREQHADAALLSSERTYRTGSVAWAAPGVYGVTPLTSTKITANLIKYK
jgi:hypothetical protein